MEHEEFPKEVIAEEASNFQCLKPGEDLVYECDIAGVDENVYFNRHGPFMSVDESVINLLEARMRGGTWRRGR